MHNKTEIVNIKLMVLFLERLEFPYFLFSAKSGSRKLIDLSSFVISTHFCRIRDGSGVMRPPQTNNFQ